MDLSCSAVPSETEQNIIVIMLMVMQIVTERTMLQVKAKKKTSYTVARRPVVNNFISLNRAIFLPDQF